MFKTKTLNRTSNKLPSSAAECPPDLSGAPSDQQPFCPPPIQGQETDIPLPPPRLGIDDLRKVDGSAARLDEVEKHFMPIARQCYQSTI